MKIIDLTNSKTNRQNILNNHYALNAIYEVIGYEGFKFENDVWFTKTQVAQFFEVNISTVERYLKNHHQELYENGYVIFTGKRLYDAKKADVTLVSEGASLGLFSFQAFLNLAMLLAKSDRARTLRSIILDVTINTINQRIGVDTKYINQKDANYIVNLISGEGYHKEFIEALNICVNMGNAKYPIYINKIYKSIFGENAEEYRRILRLSTKEKVRDTMYSEVLNIISSYETGFADELKSLFNQKKEKLLPNEVDELFDKFSNQKLWKPLIDKARTEMASRDNYFRQVKHEKLKEYIGPVSKEDFDKFLSEKSQELNRYILENIDVFKRLKDK